MTHFEFQFCFTTTIQLKFHNYRIIPITPDICFVSKEFLHSKNHQLNYTMLDYQHYNTVYVQIFEGHSFYGQLNFYGFIFEHQ